MLPSPDPDHWHRTATRQSYMLPSPDPDRQHRTATPNPDRQHRTATPDPDRQHRTATPDPDRWHRTATTRSRLGRASLPRLHDPVAGTVLLLLDSVASIVLLPPDLSLAPYCYPSRPWRQHHAATPPVQTRQTSTIAQSYRGFSTQSLRRIQTRSFPSFSPDPTPVAGIVLLPPDTSRLHRTATQTSRWHRTATSRPVTGIVLLP